jgi:RNA polymerase sigma-70 factor (ECF subfamily)
MLQFAMTADASPFDPPRPVERDDDHALVRAAGLGDTLAFEQLYRRHVRRVHAVVWRLAGGQAARAEDLVQEAFIRAWQALPAFRFESAFSTWLHRLAINTALMTIRQRAGGEDRETDDAALAYVASPDTAGQRLREQMDLERAVATLPERAPRGTDPARHRRLEARGNRQRAGHGRRQFESSASSRPQPVAAAPGRRT